MAFFIPIMDIIVYSKSRCTNCDFIKNLLTHKGLPFKEVNIEPPEERIKFFGLFPNARSLPVVTVDGKQVEDLTSLATLGAA